MTNPHAPFFWWRGVFVEKGYNKNMGNYSVFAKFYDSAMKDRTAEAENVEKLIKKFNPGTKKILELGCGTGFFLKFFLDRGYDVAGIDLSEEMLVIAQQKLPDISLSQQDMATFASPTKYDTILCLFDSINHLLDYESWEKVFFNTHNNLNKKGVFIFDINTKKKLDDLVASSGVVSEFDRKIMSIKVTLNRDVYNWSVKTIEKGPNNKEITHIQNVQEKTFSTQRIEQSLKKVFKEVVLFNPNGDEVTEDAKRVYFVCVK
jgi:cyclopropane fatty-acyl-phospholipid synthase-like methyltransferase